MTKQKRWFFALLLSLMPVASHAADLHLNQSHGISFAQLDFSSDQLEVANSRVGRLTANLLTLRQSTGKQSGYLNLSVNGNWVVRNLPVFAENQFPYSHISGEFDLGVNPGTNVTTLNASIVYSDQAMTAMPAATAVQFPVGSITLSPGGSLADGAIGAGTPTDPPDATKAIFNTNGETRGSLQLDHPNIEAAKNQCVPASIANSLQFLEDTTDLEIPHAHRAGLKGDSSLVGQLDSYMNRTAPSRTSGEGVIPSVEITGKLKYLAANGLGDRVQTRHWGWSGDTNFSQTVSGKTATSQGQGLKLDNFEGIISALQAGENCEINYYWAETVGAATRSYGHAVDLIGAGYTKGQPWILEASDMNQDSDSDGAGARGVRYHYLTEMADGYPNLDGTVYALQFLMCQKFVPPTTSTGTVIPPPGTALFLPSTGVTITSIVDPAGHICCVNPPPGTIDLNFSGGDVTLSGNASWLPITLDINAQGNLSGSNTATVAGFSNVHNNVTGTLSASGINAAITLGTQGELFGVPITFNVAITPDEPWPWSSTPVTPHLAPAIRVNGFRHDLAIAPGDPVSLNLSLTQGDRSGPADWWVVAQAGSTLLSYSLASGSWVNGLVPTYQGPLFDLPNIPLFSLPTGLPSGTYNFYFGVDMAPNGILDAGTLNYDYVTLTVQ